MVYLVIGFFLSHANANVLVPNVKVHIKSPRQTVPNDFINPSKNQLICIEELEQMHLYWNGTNDIGKSINLLTQLVTQQFY
jgi:hypothetical protein